MIFGEFLQLCTVSDSSFSPHTLRLRSLRVNWVEGWRIRGRGERWRGRGRRGGGKVWGRLKWWEEVGQ